MNHFEGYGTSILPPLPSVVVRALNTNVSLEDIKPLIR